MLNPMPEQVGGEPTRTSKTYALIRKAVGTGGSAANDLGLEGLWRRSKAHGLAAATSSTERAIMQMDPHLATDYLPYYERVLGIVPAANDAPSTRAQNAGTQWTRALDASIPAIADGLARIDPRLTVLSPAHAKAATTQQARTVQAFDSTVEGPAFGGGQTHTHYPNYSTEFTVNVRFTLGHGGSYTNDETRIVERVKVFLRDALPSWVDFHISTASWTIGVTPIGMGACG